MSLEGMFTAKARRSWLAGLALVAAVLAPLAASAHPLAPALLELEQKANGEWEVTWKVPAVLPVGANLRPLLPSWCVPLGEPAARRDAEALRLTWGLACGERGLEGAVVGVDGLDRGGSAALLRVLFADGSTARWLLTPGNTRVEVAHADVDSTSLALRFAVLGTEHLLGGLDHLAFLVGLFLLVRGRRALLASVTAFTAGHSLTLSLAAFGCFPLSTTWVEVGIALSILVVAAEVAEGGSGILTRSPWAAALGFGLLHGAGFASALRLAGVPRADLALALASFNLGIEVGQLAFLAILLVGVAALQRLTRVETRALRRAPAYALGAIAAFWILDRLAVLL